MARVPWRSTRPRPPDNEAPEEETLIEVPADPLVESHVFSREALARDCAEIACPDDDLVSYGWSQITETQLFPHAIDDDAHAVHLDDVVDTRSEVSLADVDGQDTSGVQARATASLSSIDLLGGQDEDALTIDVLSQPTLTAVATGTPGTAEVTWTAPVVQINAEDGEDLVVRIAYGDFAQDTADDGTRASGSASVLHVEVLRAVDMGTLAELEIAPMTVEAEAPDGGVDCPTAPETAPDDAPGIDVGVDGPEEVAPGEEFDYTVDVTNTIECPIEDLVVVSDVTGPDGAEIAGTDPEGDVEGLTATWSDLEDLDVGETATFTVTVRVPEDAEVGATFRNDVTATGTCDGDGPVVADDAATLPAADEQDEPADTQPAAQERLPETGGGLALAGLAALGLATALRRRS